MVTAVQAVKAGRNKKVTSGSVITVSHSYLDCGKCDYSTEMLSSCIMYVGQYFCSSKDKIQNPNVCLCGFNFPNLWNWRGFS